MFAAVLWARPAAAHVTGTPHITNASAGDYVLTVWTAPDPVRANDFHVIVGVTRPDDANLVLGEEVMITAVPINGRQPPLIVVATHEQSDNKFLYEAYLEVQETGAYQVTVTVGADRVPEQNSVTFTVAVEAARWYWPTWLFWAGLLLLVSWLAWRNLPRHRGVSPRKRSGRREQVAHG